MSIICWDGTTLAADKMASLEDGTFFTTSKIFRRSDGVIYGVTGTCCEAIADWFENGEGVARFNELGLSGHNFSLLYIGHNRKPYLMEAVPYPVEIEDRCFAIGGAAQAGQVLMECGMSAEQAVEKVCQSNIYCGCGIDTLTP
jgi:hypothetical protein